MIIGVKRESVPTYREIQARQRCSVRKARNDDARRIQR